jgi:hypothetical protein
VVENAFNDDGKRNVVYAVPPKPISEMSKEEIFEMGGWVRESEARRFLGGDDDLCPQMGTVALSSIPKYADGDVYSCCIKPGQHPT